MFILQRVLTIAEALDKVNKQTREEMTMNFFERLHNNAPAPFNPEYKPHAKEVRRLVTASMEKDCYYDNHTREECAIEWRKRYNIEMSKYS